MKLLLTFFSIWLLCSSLTSSTSTQNVNQGRSIEFLQWLYSLVCQNDPSKDIQNVQVDLKKSDNSSIWGFHHKDNHNHKRRKDFKNHAAGQLNITEVLPNATTKFRGSGHSVNKRSPRNNDKLMKKQLLLPHEQQLFMAHQQQALFASHMHQLQMQQQQLQLQNQRNRRRKQRPSFYENEEYNYDDLDENEEYRDYSYGLYRSEEGFENDFEGGEVDLEKEGSSHDEVNSGGEVLDTFSDYDYEEESELEKNERLRRKEEEKNARLATTTTTPRPYYPTTTRKTTKKPTTTQGYGPKPTKTTTTTTPGYGPKPTTTRKTTTQGYPKPTTTRKTTQGYPKPSTTTRSPYPTRTTTRSTTTTATTKRPRPSTTTLKPKPANCRCGLQSIRGESINPTTIIRVQVNPWIVAISSGSTHLCTGFIINSLYILTAASCVNGLARSAINVTSGIQTGNSTVHSVLSIRTHPKFNPKTLDNNIALLRIKGIKFENRMRPICLPSTTSAAYFTGNLVTWAWDEDKLQLISTDVPLISQSRCENLLERTDEIKSLTRGNLCTGPPGQSKCIGDRGGVLQVYRGGYSYESIGLVSWSVGCRHSYTPGVFKDIRRYSKWIRNQSKGGQYCSMPSFYSSFLDE